MPNSYVLENAVVWINGNSLAGSVSEIELPEMTWNTIDREALGDIGMPQYATRLEELECTLTWADWEPTLAAAAANPYQAVQLQIRANVAEQSPQGKVGDRPLVIDLTGRFLQNQLGTISPNEPLDVETMMTCTYVRQRWQGNTILEVDIQVPIYRVNGVDLLAQMRANIGA